MSTNSHHINVLTAALWFAVVVIKPASYITEDFPRCHPGVYANENQDGNLILTLSYLRGNKFIGTDRFLYSNVATFVVCFFSRVMNTLATTSSKIQSESELWKSLSVYYIMDFTIFC